MKTVLEVIDLSIAPKESADEINKVFSVHITEMDTTILENSKYVVRLSLHDDNFDIMSRYEGETMEQILPKIKGIVQSYKFYTQALRK